jgi:hypothetical protein
MPRASVAHRQRRKSEIQLERHWKDGLNGGNPITEAIVTFIAGTLHRLKGHCPNVTGPSLVLVCRLSNRVSFRLSDSERRSGGVDLAQDVFALGFAHVAPGVLIARRQEGDDGVGQFSGRGKALFGNELGEVAKEALDQIHPG